MTINKVLTEVDGFRDNAVEHSVKAEILIKLEKRIIKELTDGDVEMSYPEDEDTELFLPDMWSDIYVHYLCAMLSLYAKEYDDYNNEVTVYNNEYSQFKEEYIRTHETKRHNFRGYF